jgi:hypothetical protein
MDSTNPAVPSGPPITVSAEELAKEFKADAAATDKKYKDRILIVEGKVHDVYGEPTLVLWGYARRTFTIACSTACSSNDSPGSSGEEGEGYPAEQGASSGGGVGGPPTAVSNPRPGTLAPAACSPYAGEPDQELAQSFVGPGQEGGPALAGEPQGFFLGRRLAGLASLIPGVGGEPGRYFACVHFTSFLRPVHPSPPPARG